jgi:cytochrome c
MCGKNQTKQVTPVQALMLAGLFAMTSPTQAAVVFTVAQAQAGRECYQQHCATCHQPNLSGGAVPELAGPVFRSRWRPHTPAQLYGFIKAMMPLDDAGSLRDQDYIDLTAFLLSANGAKAGKEPFTGKNGMQLRNILPQVHER